MKKKNFSAILLVILIMCTSCLFACVDKQKNEEKVNNEIQLTLENYNYYLTITSQLIDSGSYAGGTLRIASYNVYISGAIYGIYQDCVLYLKNGNEIKINAAGNAQTKKTITNGEDSFVVERVEGKIILYN